MLTDLANTLRDQGGVDESGCFIDMIFSSASKGQKETADPGIDEDFANMNVVGW